MGTGESIPDTLRLSLCGPETIKAATRAALDFGAIHEIGETDTARLAIAVEELITNLFEHGGLATDDVVELALSRTGDVIGLAITDQGSPFDPRTATQGDAIPERGGGAGLALVRAWASESNYEVSGAGNRLSISLQIGPR